MRRSTRLRCCFAPPWSPPSRRSMRARGWRRCGRWNSAIGIRKRAWCRCEPYATPTTTWLPRQAVGWGIGWRSYYIHRATSNTLRPMFVLRSDWLAARSWTKKNLIIENNMIWLSVHITIPWLSVIGPPAFTTSWIHLTGTGTNCSYALSAPWGCASICKRHVFVKNY